MKNLSTRELPQSWIIEKNTNKIGKGLEEFADYCENFEKVLNSIKKLDEKEFNKLSPISIKDYINEYNETFSKIYELLIDKSKVEAYLDNGTNVGEYYFLNFPEFYKRSAIEILEEDNFNGRIIPREMRIKDEIYPTINKLAIKLFNLEEMCYLTTKQMWQNLKLINDRNDIRNLDKNNYGMFAKIIYDWRRESKDDPAIHDYMVNRYGISASFITNKKSRFFKCDSLFRYFGLIYDTKGFMYASNYDAYLEETIDGKSPLKDKITYTNVKRLSKINNHEIFGDLIKCCTPNVALNQNIDNYNEIVLDKRKTKPIAVFYIDKIDGKQLDALEQVKREAEKLAFKFRVPVITLESKNENMDHEEKQC